MPGSGSGTGTPISPGGPVVPGAYQLVAPIRTLLSLSRYARIMGINPVSFQGATAGTVFPIRNACADIWHQFSWQDTDHVSRDDLALEIANAERDIAQFLGYWPAPVWIAEEELPWPEFHRRTAHYPYSIGFPTVNLKYGKLLEFGQRSVSLVGTATTATGTLVYSDEDGDGFDETATIVLPTTVTSACEIGVFVPGFLGDEAWEIRSARTISISGGNVTIKFDSWLLVDPELQQAYPTTEDPSAIDLTDPASFLQSVDVYRVYNDTSVNAVAYFEPEYGIVCADNQCNFETETFCASVYDRETGIAKLNSATYSNGAWNSTCCTGCYGSHCYDPTKVRLWYKSGLESDRYKRGLTCDPLGDEFARIIAHMATARLERPVCSCGNLTALYKKLQIDLLQTGENVGFQLNDELISNPFGTRFGEVEAYKYLSKIVEKRYYGYAIL